MILRLLFLFLYLALLPACPAVQPYPTSTRAAGEVKPSESSLFQKADSSYHSQAYRQAEQQFAYYLELYPQGSRAQEARLRQAEIKGLLGDWQGSLQLYQDLLARQPDPNSALKARYGIGRAYFKLEEYQQATQVLDNLTASDMPRSMWFSTQALLAEIALKQGRVTQAFNRLRLASQDLASGDSEWFQDLKARLLNQATAPELEQMASLHPNDPLTAAIFLRLARLSQEAGRPEAAAKWLETLQARFPNSPETAAAEGLVTGRKVVLGSLLPLSGQLSGIGFKIQRGMELAAKKAPVKLLFKDATDADSAARYTRELAQDSKVLAVLGPVSSAAAQSAAEAAQNSSIPLIALSQKSGITQAGPVIFQAFLTPRQQVRALVSYAASKGIKNFTILYPDSAYGRTFFEEFTKEVAAQGGEVVTQAFYSPGSQAFTPTLAAMAESLKIQTGQSSSNYALFVPDDAATVAAIVAARNETPLKGSLLLGTNLLHTSNISSDHLMALQGIVFPDAFFAGDPNPAVQEFVTSYRRQYGTDPDYLATQGYLVLRLMTLLAESGQPLSRTSLPGQLLSLKADSSLPWFKGFNEQREEEPALYLLTISGGSIQMVPSSPSAGSRG